MNCFAKLTDLPETSDLIRSDFEKRYLNTYMRQTIDSKERIVYFIGFDGSNAHFRDSQSGKTAIHSIREDVALDTFLPNVGYYNVMGRPMYLYKNPQKQWKRSFCNSIYVTDAPGMNGRQDNATAWRDIALEVMKPVYAHLDELTKKLYAYVALTKKFAIAADPQGNMNLLYRQYTVGRLDFASHIITVLQPTLKQEIMDLLKYTGVTTWKLQ